MRRSLCVTAVTAGLAFAAMLSLVPPRATAHCEVPCGIYDDPMRVTMLKEDATTIQKAVTSMGSLVKDSENALAMNQFVRWTTVKDDAATNIQRIVSDYFLTQRVKAVPAGDPGHAAYLDQLAKMHAILVAAMKCKQTADPVNVQVLIDSIDAIAPMYSPHDHHGG